MKIIEYVIILLSISLFSCSKNTQNNLTILSGKIENPNTDSLIIFKDNHVTRDLRKIVDVIHLNEENKFIDSIELENGYYTLSDGVEETVIYLMKDYNLQISINTKNFDESLKYIGDGAKENNYLASSFLLNESFGQKKYYGYFVNLGEQDFLKLTDSIYNEEMRLFEQFSKDFNKDFYFTELKKIDINKSLKIYEYEPMKRYFTNEKDFKVGKNFPPFFENIDLKNDLQLNIPLYIPFIQEYLYYKFTKSSKQKNTLDLHLLELNIIHNEIKNPKIQERLAFSIGVYNLDNTKEIDEVYHKVVSMIENEEFIKEVNKNYLNVKGLEKGKNSPNFTFSNDKGQNISLDNFKGELVYIDIWATWCLPCIKEIPHMKELQEKFIDKNIVFISICIESEKDKWLNTLQEHQISGIQLFAPNKENKFLQLFDSGSVPHFIILDSEGKILNANAKAPSNNELINELNTYLGVL